ncbi:WXG100 family type VII secretion target [Nocardia anaemiae]|uniref:WXG100 family type VII secretion target n=1 Tax=Nocardia anaemiae TaxID=263910 RepID=UPI0007A4CDA7|nr:hypothetical protein [Nocardia anaemiae]
MNDRVQLDPDSLRRDSARLAELGDQVARTYAGLRDSLANANGCWGDDDLGEAFAKNFTPQADELLRDLQAMAESLRGTAQQAAAAAHDFEAQDLDSAGQIGRAGDEAYRPDQNYGTGVRPSSAIPSAGSAAPATTSLGPDAGTVRNTPAGQPISNRTPTEQQASGRPRGSSGKPSTSRNSPQSSNPPAGTSDPQGGSKSAGDPSRRPPSSPVSPPVGAGRDAPRNPSATSPGPGTTPGRKSAPRTGGRRETPWTGPPPKSGSAPSTPNSSNPRPGSPPRSPKSAEPRKRDRGRETERSTRKPGLSPIFAWLARTLAHRHHVTVIGFDLPDLQETPVREFAAAVDRVLTEYPMIELDVVAVGDLGEDAREVRWRRDVRDSATVRSITLDRRVACEPSPGVGTPETEAGPNDSAVGSATVRELGLALNHAGGGVAREVAQRALIAEYMRVVAGRYTTLGELLRGFRHWRAELNGATGAAGGFEVYRALGIAFADVVLHGERASAAAKILHAVLVDAAAPPG